TVAANNTNEEKDDIIPWIPYRADGWAIAFENFYSLSSMIWISDK
ncbi:hypothetical protein HMPREF1989_00691, partial [Porphyromonas gingivalis F0566]